MSRRRSIIWKLEVDKLRAVVAQASTINEILQFFNLSNKGGNHKTLKKRLIEEGIEFNHIKQGLNSNNGRRFKKEKLPLSEILVDGRPFGTVKLKNRLLSENFLEEKCSECGIDPEWNNKNLVLQLDHINGKRDDNRLENLRILCPNCHSQTETFAGRSLKKSSSDEELILNKKVNNIQLSFGWAADYNYIESEKNVRGHRRRVLRPSKEELEKMLWEMPITKIAEKYGVSDKAIHKWIRSYEITNKPLQGYWLKTGNNK